MKNLQLFKGMPCFGTCRVIYDKDAIGNYGLFRDALHTTYGVACCMIIYENGGDRFHYVLSKNLCANFTPTAANRARLRRALNELHWGYSAARFFQAQGIAFI